MDFHVITPHAVVHLFSTEGGRVVSGPANILFAQLKSCMRFREPLTKTVLQDIQGRNPDADVRALLWEVARLRSNCSLRRPTAAHAYHAA